MLVCRKTKRTPSAHRELSSSSCSPHPSWHRHRRLTWRCHYLLPEGAMCPHQMPHDLYHWSSHSLSLTFPWLQPLFLLLPLLVLRSRLVNLTCRQEHFLLLLMSADMQTLLQQLSTKADLQLLPTRSDQEKWAQCLEDTFKLELDGLQQQKLTIETRVTALDTSSATHESWITALEQLSAHHMK